MNIGITGSTGVIGNILSEKLKSKDLNIIPFEGDIRSKIDLANWFKNDFDTIFHLAAVVPVNIVANDPILAYSVNVGGTINLIEKIIENKKNKIWLFYASSAHVYKSSNQPISEKHPIEPITLYGETKWMGERVCTEAAKANDIAVCCGRIFSFYHKSQKKPFLYPTIRERLENKDLTKPFKLYGADSVRDFLNAEEVVEIIVKLMQKKTTGIINIASGQGVKIRDFVQQFTNVKLKIEPADNKVNYLIADTSKLNKVLGE